MAEMVPDSLPAGRSVGERRFSAVLTRRSLAIHPRV